jgi:hypothetical protein
MNKKYRQLALFILGIIGVIYSCFALVRAYELKDNFKLFLRIVWLVIFVYWTITYYKSWRMHARDKR